MDNREGSRSYIAFAGLAVALGCPEDAVGTLWDRMLGQGLPMDPLQAVESFRRELAALREATTPGEGA